MTIHKNDLQINKTENKLIKKKEVDHE